MYNIKTPQLARLAIDFWNPFLWWCCSRDMLCARFSFSLWKFCGVTHAYPNVPVSPAILHYIHSVSRFHSAHTVPVSHIQTALQLTKDPILATHTSHNHLDKCVKSSISHQTRYLGTASSRLNGVSISSLCTIILFTYNHHS